MLCFHRSSQHWAILFISQCHASPIDIVNLLLIIIYKSNILKRRDKQPWELPVILEIWHPITQTNNLQTFQENSPPPPKMEIYQNKANLRDLIAATGLVILLKFDPNHRFFVPCDLEIWWMTLENNRAPLLYYIKLCLSFQIHWCIETEVTVRKRSIRVKIGNFFVPCDLEIWRMTSKNNRAPLLCCFKLCASFHSHQWIQTGVRVRKCPILVKIDDFF